MDSFDEKQLRQKLGFWKSATLTIIVIMFLSGVYKFTFGINDRTAVKNATKTMYIELARKDVKEISSVICFRESRAEGFVRCKYWNYYTNERGDKLLDSNVMYCPVNDIKGTCITATEFAKSLL